MIVGDSDSNLLYTVWTFGIKDCCHSIKPLFPMKAGLCEEHNAFESDVAFAGRVFVCHPSL